MNAGGEEVRVGTAAAGSKIDESGAGSPRGLTVFIHRSGEILKVSGSVEEILGHSPGDVVGRRAIEFVHRDDRRYVLAAFAAVAESGQQESRVVSRVRQRDGSWRWFVVTFKRQVVGEELQVRCLMSDLTRARAVYGPTPRPWGTLRLVAELLPVGFVLTTWRGSRVIYANRAVHDILGYPVLDVLGRTMTQLRWWPDAATRRRVMARLRRHASVGNLEMPLRTKDGRTCWCLVSLTLVEGASVLKGYSGPTVLVTFVDITARKELENALRESEAKYRRLLEDINEVALETDPDGHIIYISPAARRKFGHDPGEMMGRPLANFVHPDDVTRVVEATRQAARGQPQPIEFRLLTKDGQVRWVRSDATPVLRSGQVIALQGVLTDITDLKRAEDELRRLSEERARLAQRLLRAQEEEHRRLAYELHDGVEQLVNVAQMYLGTYLGQRRRRRTPSGENLEKAYRYLEMAARELAAVIAGLRPFGLDEMGLDAALRRYASSVAAASGMTVAFRSRLGAERLPPYIEWAVFRVAQEAITNALKHSHSQRLAVTLRRVRLSRPLGEGATEWVLLRVRDWGRGFQVLDQEGGVGLASMRERASLVRGELSVRSRPGAGTVVSLRVPLFGP